MKKEDKLFIIYYNKLFEQEIEEVIENYKTDKVV